MSYRNVSSMIFTPVKPLPEVLGEPRLRDDVLKQICQDPETRLLFGELDTESQNALIEFCMGNRSLKITYDPFFRNIMNPVKYPERISCFLSQILGQKVTVKAVLPREGVRLSSESSLMIMDLLVELEDGSLVNLEMQKVGYDFPVERSFCYGADLLVRQYDRIHGEAGARFTYRSMRPVYIIVLMEHSPALFWKKPDTYIHRSTFRFDSGLSLDGSNLINFVYVPLDIFLKMPHNELTELEAWLYFLSSDNPLHVQQIITKYPLFQQLYLDIIHFRYAPKELIHMFSEALIAADRNTVRLMIDEMRQELTQKDAKLSEKDAKLSEKEEQISGMSVALSEKDEQLSEKDEKISGMSVALSEKDEQLSEKDAEIARLKELLAMKQS